MNYCIKCGKELPDGARFCAFCGVPVEAKTDLEPLQRREEYVGTIMKCPACGEPVDPLVEKCAVCGLEMRKVRPTSTVQNFIRKIDGARNIDEKLYIIKNCPLPNTKDELLNFMALATSNIDLSAYSIGGSDYKYAEYLNDAWDAIIIGVYAKAKSLFPQDPTFTSIEQLYKEFHTDVLEYKKKGGLNTVLFCLIPIGTSIVFIALIMLAMKYAGA